MRPARLALALVAAALFVALPAAPARADDAGEAKVMFDHGLEEMKRGRFDAACPALAESYKRNPLPGALFTLADCEAQRGRIATAVKRYEEYLGVYAKLPKDKLAKQRGRDAHSKEQISLLLPQLPKVTIVLADAEADGLVVTLDGIALDKSALGGPIPIDPGDHVLFVQTPGEGPNEQRFSIAKAEQKTLAPGAKAKPQTDAPDAPAGSGGGALKLAGIVVGSTGVATLVVGAVTGGLALGKKSVVKQNCQLDDVNRVASCNPAGLDAGKSAKALGAVSTGTFIGGAVLAGAGVALLVVGLGKDRKDAGAARLTPTFSAGPDHVMFGVGGAL